MMSKRNIKILILVCALASSFLFALPPGNMSVVSAQCYELINGGPDAVEVPCPPDDVTVTTIDRLDSDDDGVPDHRDNCPGVSNSDQTDTWGSDLGNACDTEYVDNLTGTKAFRQHDGTYHLYGDCFVNDFGDFNCQHIATLDLCALPAEIGYSMFVPNPSAPHSDQEALVTLVSVVDKNYNYQINVMDSNAVTIGTPLTISFPSNEIILCGATFNFPQLDGALLPTIPLTDSFEDHQQFFEEINVLVDNDDLTALEMLQIKHMLNTWSLQVGIASSLTKSLYDTYVSIIQSMP